MRRSLVLVVALACGCVANAPTSAPPDDADTPVTPRYQPLADAIEAERAQLGAPGVAVLVMEHGAVTFARGFGSKDPQKSDPVRATTLFRIGSCTKMLTAIALSQLVAKGSVDLESPITQYLPGLDFATDPMAAAKIKVKHLLTHTGGIVDDMAPYHVPSDADDAALASYTFGTFAQQDFTMAPPGAMWNYSNPDFSLAGLIVEKAGGLPYRQAMHDRVFAPLGMTRTFFIAPEVTADGDFSLGLATPAMGFPTAQTVRADSYDDGWSRPAGFAWSSVRDLAKLVTFFSQGDDAVLPSAQRNGMQSAQVDTKEIVDYESYGYGLFVDSAFYLGPDLYALDAVWHDGGIAGYSSELFMIPSLQFAFIQLANTDDAFFYRSLRTAAQTLLSLPAPIAAPTPPQASSFDKYAGTYQDDHSVGKIVVAKSGDSLSLSLPDLDAQGIKYTPTLTPDIGDGFVIAALDGAPEYVTFIADSNGTYTYFRTREFVGKRTP